MWQIQRQVQHLLDASAEHMTLTAAVVFVGGVMAIWLVCNGWRK